MTSTNVAPIATSAINNKPKILNMTRANRWEMFLNYDKKVQPDTLELETRPGFEEQSCADLILNDTAPATLLYPHNIYVEEKTDAYRTILSNFTDGNSGYSLCLWDDNILHSTKVCAIPESWKCDNYSSCPTDECGCHGDDTFKCADGSGCISLRQVCDSRPDCTDLSDECACHDFRSCLRPIRLLDGSHYEDCYRPPTCVETRNTMINTPDFVRFNKELMEGEDSGQISLSRLALCKEYNSPFHFHCNKLQVEILTNRTIYECSDYSSIAATYPIDNEYPFISHSIVFCDGVINCRNGVDEQNCPQMFYCKSDQKAVAKTQTCDSVPDCSDFSDECDESCSMSSIYSSHSDLIEHNTMLIILYVETLGIFCLNVHAFSYLCKRMRGVGTYWADVVLCLTLLFHNLTTGAYLVIICWQRWELRGEYCSRDLAWRSSLLCKVAGALSYAASRGTLQSVVIGTVFRITHRWKVDSNRVKMLQVLPVFLVANLFNLTMAFSPLLSLLFNLPGWTEMFTHEYIFKNNPLIRKGNKTDLELLVSVYKELYLDVTENLSPLDLLAQLQNMTSRGHLFSPEQVTMLGIYGASPLCFPNVLTAVHPMWVYRAVFMAENTVFLIVLIASFSSISREFLKSRTMIAPSIALSQEEQDRSSCFFLSFKFWLVVGSQLLTWLPVQGALIAIYVGPCPSKSNMIKIIDVLAVNVIPLNAIVIPILQTKLADRLLPRMQKMSKAVVTRFFKPPCLFLYDTESREHQIDMTSVTEIELNVINRDTPRESPAVGESGFHHVSSEVESSRGGPATERSDMDDVTKMELIFKIMECH
ncbi:hypothetical protein ACHWQZ_G018208 [Mnemiopsis leidyi]